jgi:hypothetical protein
MHEALLDYLECHLRDDNTLPDATAGAFPRETAGQTTTKGLEELALKMASLTAADPNATFDRPRSYVQNQVITRKGGAPRPKMRMRVRPLVDNDPRSEAADIPKS